MAGESFPSTPMSKRTRPGGEYIHRERLKGQLEEILGHGLGLITGAAGSGKTTSLLQLCDQSSDEVAWLRLDPGDGRAERTRLLLAEAFGVSSDLATLEELVRSIEQRPHDVVLLLDDVHTVAGTESSSLLAQLAQFRPRNLCIVMASRFSNPVDVCHQHALTYGKLVSGDDLRFRSWEISDLLSGAHLRGFSAADVRILERYTGGWAVALKLLSVLLRDSGTQARARLLAKLPSNPDLLHDFLIQNLLSALPEQDRDYALRTAVLEHLTPSRCRDLTGNTEAFSFLHRTRHAGLYQAAPDRPGAVSCHDLLRSHLLVELETKVGSHVVAELFRCAAQIAESEGSVGEAIRYFARADDHGAVQRLLVGRHEELLATHSTWWDRIPASICDNDPIVQLAEARRLVRNGSLEQAVQTYERSLKLRPSGSARHGEQELRQLRSFLDPRFVHSAAHRAGGIAAQLNSQVSTAQRRNAPLVDGIGLIFDGRLIAADDELRRAETQMVESWSLVATTCRLVLAKLMDPDADVSLRASQLCRAAESLGIPALRRIGDALLRRTIEPGDQDSLVEEADGAGDHLGAAWICFIAGLASLGQGRQTAIEHFAEAGRRFVELGHSAAADLSSSIAFAIDPSRGDAPAPQRRLAQEIHRSSMPASALQSHRNTPLANGLQPLRETIASMGPQQLTQADRTIHLLGAFKIDGVEVEAELSPLNIRVLVCLLVHTGQWLHIDHLMTYFWPERSTDRALRSLQVAISSVRKLLKANQIGTVERNGARYQIVLSSDWNSDFADLQTLLHSPITDPGTIRSLQQGWALVAHEFGAEEWVVERQQDLVSSLTEQTLAMLHQLIEQGDEQLALEMANAGLKIDPYEHRLWQIALPLLGGHELVESNARYQELFGLAQSSA